MYRSLLVMVVLVAILAVGCTPPPMSSPDDTTSAPSGAETPAGAPDFANQAVEWLAGEVNIPVGDFRFVEAEQVEWTDSCFGLGGPAESCLAAVTPGWRIAFEAGGQQYEVRTDQSGSAFRLAPQGS